LVIETRRATAADAARAAKVLADAFADYPWTRWTVDADDHHSRLEQLQLMAIERYGLPYGQVWVTTVDSAIHCVALWMDTGAAVPPELHAELTPRVEELEGSRHAASIAAERELEASRPTQHVYALGTIGTSPSMQRRGLAARTLAPVLDRADRDGVDAFLETSSESNVAFYESLGFVVTDQCTISGGGPQVWSMLRRPART
jgi:GNAT superfamily N-acetyltransferase